MPRDDSGTREACCFHACYSSWSIDLGFSRDTLFGPLQQYYEHLYELQALQLPFEMLLVLCYSSRQAKGRLRPGEIARSVNICLPLFVMAVNIVSVAQFTKGFIVVGCIFTYIYVLDIPSCATKW